MSCHVIGHGMSTISGTILDLCEEKEISKRSVVRLIRACRKSVHLYDGNESEAIEEVVYRGCCGLCFQQSEDLESIYDNDLPYPDCDDVFKDYDGTADHYWLCPDCTKRVLAKFVS